MVFTGTHPQEFYYLLIQHHLLNTRSGSLVFDQCDALLVTLRRHQQNRLIYQYYLSQPTSDHQTTYLHNGLCRNA